jgi:hypothetical protein
MARARISPCGRFAVVDALHVDRNVFDALAQWASDHGLSIQDAVQVALCAFTECVSEGSNVSVPASSHEPRHDALESKPSGQVD